MLDGRALVGPVDTVVMHSYEALDDLKVLLQCLSVTEATRVATAFSVYLKFLAQQTV